MFPAGKFLRPAVAGRAGLILYAIGFGDGIPQRCANCVLEDRRLAAVFLFRAVMYDELVRKGGIELGAFDNLGPGRVWEEPGLEVEDGHAQRARLALRA